MGPDSLLLRVAVAGLFCLSAARGSLAQSVAEQYLVAAANQERAALGLGQLHWDKSLARAAAGHARVMAAHGSISHQFAGEPELTARGASAGVHFSAISENVAEAPSAVTIHEMWMRSEGHRKNLLDSNVDAVGISVVERGGELYAVEDFAKTVRAMSFEEQEAAVASLVLRPGLRVLNAEGDPDLMAAARKTCSMETGYAGPRKPYFVMRYTAGSLTALPEPLATRIASGKYREAVVGACKTGDSGPFTSYNIAVLLYP